MPHMKNSTKKTSTAAPQNSTARQCIIIEHLTEQYQRNDSITVRIVVRRMRKKTARICSTILCSTEIGAESRREMPASTVMNTYKSVCTCATCSPSPLLRPYLYAATITAIHTQHAPLQFSNSMYSPLNSRRRWPDPGKAGHWSYFIQSPLLHDQHNRAHGNALYVSH